MAPEQREALLSVAQAAMILGVHPNTIRAWTDAGRLSAYRINARGDRRFRRDDVERILVEDASRSDDFAQSVERAAELAVFEHVASGLAATPAPAAVARALVEALRTEMQVARAAVYVRLDDLFELTAHAGFATAPLASRALGSEPDAGGADREIVLATRKTALGILVIDSASADRMSPSFLRAVSTTAATALGSSRLVVSARRELSRVRALRSVTKELTGTLDLERVLADIIERTRTLFGADRAGIWHFDGTPNPIALVTRGLGDAFLARSADLTASSDTIAIHALREGRPLWMRNADRDSAVGEMREAYATEGIRTVCLAPLISRGAALGVIGLYHDSDRTWPDEEVELAQAFADQAAIAIQNARLYRSVAEQAARMRSIQDLSARLNRLTDVRAIAEAIVAEASTLAHYHDIRVYRVDWDRRVCDAIAFTREMLDGNPEDAESLLRVAIGEGFTGWVAEHGKPQLINDAVDDERGKTIDGTDDVPESMLLIPMLYEGRALGVIVLSQLGYDRFSADDLQTMSIFAGYAAQAMANATTYEQLVTQSTELRRRADSQRYLLETNERLLGTLDQADVLEMIADGLREVVSYDNLSIYRIDHLRGAMMPVLARERHAE
ncbi:MAG: GAF domain-containing protein, partial [Candidatus Limnocylindria bacterium]